MYPKGGDLIPSPGDVCESCRLRWEEQGKEPKILVASSGKTEVKGERISLCPYCDGDAGKITKLDNHEMPKENE